MKTLETSYDTVAARLENGSDVIAIPYFEESEIRVYHLPTGDALTVRGLLTLPEDAELVATESMEDLDDGAAVYEYCEELLQRYSAELEADAPPHNLVSAEERSTLQSNVIPVYCHYSGQLNRQPAYIVIAPEKDHPVYADYSGEIGNAVTAYHWHGRDVHISISPESFGPSILEFIDSHAAEIAAIIADYECDWDGSNHVGRWGEEADQLLDKLQRAADNEIQSINVISDMDDLNLDIDADTDPQSYAREIWDGATTIGNYSGSPEFYGDWYPAFDLEDLTEYITKRVSELKEEDEE